MKLSGKIIWLAFFGGALGTFIRLIMGDIVRNAIPLGGDIGLVIFINVIGSAILGSLNGNKKYDKETLSAFWKTGFTGGFTIMSAFAGLNVLYTREIGVIAFLYTAIFTALALGAYWLAFKISRDRKRA